MFLSNGFDAFISKPIDVMLLDMTLDRGLRDRRREETARRDERHAGGDEKPADTGTIAFLSGHGVDLAAGVRRYENENAFLQILRSYADHTPKLLDKIRGVSGETLGEYAVTVHGLKGASHGICAGAIAEDAQVLETAAKSGDLNTILEKNGAFIQKVETLLAALRGLPSGVTEKTEKETKASPDTALLAELSEAAGRFFYSATDEILTELERFNYESGGELIAQIRKRLDGLEYKEIQKHIDDALGKLTQKRNLNYNDNGLT
jgi:HPt (histidine-containing phosphotransfer) domain-containing protein